MIELPEHYDSIETLPMINWNRIHKKFDVSYLLLKHYKLKEEQRSELEKVWDLIYKEFINTFGFGDQFNSIIEQKLKIARLQRKHIITGDDSISNFIRANEIQLIELEKKGTDGGDIYQTKQFIEKYFGVKISLSDCTVMDFFSYIKTMKIKK